MTTRREFLQAGIAASALPLGATIRAASPEADSLVAQALPFYRVVFDERFADSLTFATEMRARGATLQPIRGDITEFWYRDLYAVWRDRPAAVAGLTAHGPLFCLEQLARDHRMRIVYRAEHLYRPDASVSHVIAAPEVVIPRTAALAKAGHAWSAHVAGLVSGCPGGRPLSRAAIVTPEAHRLPDGQDPLYSWVIAPATAA